MEVNKNNSAVIRSERRHYDDACGTAHGLDLIGERWALLVMRELLLGPRRFSDLRNALPGISANILTQRLEGLEGAGLLVRRRLPPPAATQVYELTEWGLEVEPVISVLGRWAVRSPRHEPSLHLSAVSLIMSLRTMFQPERAGDARITIGIETDGESFYACLAEGRLDTGRGAPERPDAVLRGTPAAIAGAIYDGRPLEDFERDGLVEIAGDRALVKRFFGCFALPAKAGIAGV